MATELDVFSGSYEAAADLSTHQFKIVKLDTTGKAALAGAGVGDGVLQNDPKAGQAANVRFLGQTKLKVNGNSVAIAVGDPLKSDANGFGVKAATDKDKSVAIAEEAATADAVIISARLTGINHIGV